MRVYFTIDKDDGNTSIFPLRNSIKEARELYYARFPDAESRKHFREVKVYRLGREYGDHGPLKPFLHGYYDKTFSKKRKKKVSSFAPFNFNPWSKANAKQNTA